MNIYKFLREKSIPAMFLGENLSHFYFDTLHSLSNSDTEYKLQCAEKVELLSTNLKFKGAPNKTK